jgi:hypothetical protein
MKAAPAGKAGSSPVRDLPPLCRHQSDRRTKLRQTLLQLAGPAPDAAKDQGFAFAGAEEVSPTSGGVRQSPTGWRGRPGDPA